MPARARRASGFALTATTLKNPKRKPGEKPGRLVRVSTRADGQQDFLAERVLELLEFQRGFGLVNVTYFSLAIAILFNGRGRRNVNRPGKPRIPREIWPNLLDFGPRCP